MADDWMTRQERDEALRQYNANATGNALPGYSPGTDASSLRRRPDDYVTDEVRGRQHAAIQAAEQAGGPVPGVFRNVYSFVPSTAGNTDMLTAAQNKAAGSLTRPASTGPQPGGSKSRDITIGNMPTKETTDPDGTRRYDFGQYGSATVWPRSDDAANRQQAPAARGYDAAAAQRAAAMNPYGGAGSYRQVQGRPDLYYVQGNAGGYGFQGSAEDAARFGAPVFNSAHRVQDGPNETFLRYRAEERARRNAPQTDQGPMGWKRLRARADNESRERIAALGYDQEMARQALQGRQIDQQFLLGMGNLANSNMQTQAALGQNAAQTLQTQALMEAYQRLRNARTPEERAQAAQEMQMLGGGGRAQQGETARRDEKIYTETDTDPATGETATRYMRLTPEGMQEIPRVRQQGANFSDDLRAFEAGLSQRNQEALQRIKDPRDRMMALLELYAAQNGVAAGR